MVDRPVYFRPGQRVKYEPDHKSFGAFMRSEQMRDVTAQVAGDIASLAARLAPRSKGPGPHMADQFEVKRNAGFLTVGKTHRNTRVMVHVTNSNPAAAPNEFGGRKNKRQRMLGTAGAAFGDFKQLEK